MAATMLNFPLYMHISALVVVDDTFSCHVLNLSGKRGLQGGWFFGWRNSDIIVTHYPSEKKDRITASSCVFAQRRTVTSFATTGNDWFQFLRRTSSTIPQEVTGVTVALGSLCGVA